MLQPRLRLGVAVQRGFIVGAAGHRLLERRQPLLDCDQLASAGQDVGPQRQAALPGRALVVQRDLRVLRQHQLPEVDRRFPREHSQKRRLPRAVAPGQRHPVATFELEGDSAQQGLARDVLPEIGCDHYGHRAPW